MITTIANKIKIENPSKEIINYCKDNLSLDNPNYFKAIRYGRSAWNIPRKIFLYEVVGNTYMLPFGELSNIWKFIDKKNIRNGTQCVQNQFDYKSSIVLYPYQKEALKACLCGKNGVLIAPCGSGKTQIGLSIAASVGGRTLWITHTKDLLKQSMERAKSVFGLENSDYGTITEGKINVGKVITFSTVQTLDKVDLNEICCYFDCVIVDECAHCVGTPTQITRFYNVLSRLNSRYKIGLTATPDRADGLERAMFAILGNKLYEISRNDVKEKTVGIKVHFTQTNYYPDYSKILCSDGTLNYTEIINQVCFNEERNKKIIEVVEKLEGGTMILTQRIEHCKILSEFLSKSKRVVHLSATDKKSRESAIKKLNSGEIDVVVATYQLAKEGLDCPNLRNLVLACPVSEKNTVIQAVGRVMRASPGKEFGNVYDFSDNFSYFDKMERDRLAIYKKIECNNL